jgi:hypothetical protein
MSQAIYRVFIPARRKGAIGQFSTPLLYYITANRFDEVLGKAWRRADDEGYEGQSFQIREHLTAYQFSHFLKRHEHAQ